MYKRQVQGRFDRREFIYDDGHREVIDFDEASNQTWTSAIRTYDLQNHLSLTDYRMDDGTRSYVYNDVNATQAWTCLLYTSRCV